MSGIEPGNPGYDSYNLDLILYEPYVALPLVLANSWGAGILPHHFLHDYFGCSCCSSKSPYNTGILRAKEVPAIDPYLFKTGGEAGGYGPISFVKNPLFFGYNASIVNPAGDPIGPNGETYWGPYGIDKIILDYVSDAGTRLAKL